MISSRNTLKNSMPQLGRPQTGDSLSDPAQMIVARNFSHEEMTVERDDGLENHSKYLLLYN